MIPREIYTCEEKKYNTEVVKGSRKHKEYKRTWNVRKNETKK